MFLSAGILPDVVNYVVQYCSGPLQVEGNQKRRLIECFSFLRALACKNPTVQTRYDIKRLDVCEMLCIIQLTSLTPISQLNWATYSAILHSKKNWRLMTHMVYNER